MIDFDIERVKREEPTPTRCTTSQYAHARICSILRKAAGVTPEQAAEMGMDAVAAQAIGENVDYALLTDPTELALSRKISELEDLIASCARDRAPFRLTHFAEELAGGFHSFYAALPSPAGKGASARRGPQPRAPGRSRRHAPRARAHARAGGGQLTAEQV